MIKYPKKQSEFELQAHIYNEIKSLGHDVRAEVTHYINTTKQASKCRFDLVVFIDEKPAVIIEVKDGVFESEQREELLYNMWLRTRQGIKYKSIGVPVVYCRGFHSVNRSMYLIKKYINERN